MVTAPKKIYVGNLSFKCANEDLATLFGQFGSVLSASVITDRDSGRSKGFGFVEMENDEDAKNAINSLHGKEFLGRSLTVNEARPRENNDRRGGDDRRSGGGDRYNSRR